MSGQRPESSRAVSSTERGGRLIDGLLKPSAYPHSVDSIHLVETHCAWVLLTGEYVYKVKKPVDFGFLDFSTLDKRHFFCEEEVRLNRRFAPDIYLDVVAITGQADKPIIGGSGPVLEYAVRMRQFPGDGLLSLLAEQKRLEASHIDQMIERIAEFHQLTARAPEGSVYGDAEHVHHWVMENFQHIRSSLDTPHEQEQLGHIQHWIDEERVRLDALLQSRKQNGFIRECHGDLHLGNLTLIDGKVTLFDCIEFNPELRWIDVISEVAFLVMDLEDRGYKSFAHRFLNGYLQHTGDYPGLGVLRYYLVYRAMVRAKVAMLRRQQARPDSEAFQVAQADYQQYMQLAERYIEQPQPRLLIMHGLSGSGKTTLASQLCEARGMIQIRSDVERKRMAGLAAGDDSRSLVGEDLYSSDRTEATYQYLARLVGVVLSAGFPVVVDATFLQRRYRTLMRDIAKQYQAPFMILDCVASNGQLRRRILEREEQAADASEAGLQVLEFQYQNEQCLENEELEYSLTIDTSQTNYLRDTLDALMGGALNGSV